MFFFIFNVSIKKSGLRKISQLPLPYSPCSEESVGKVYAYINYNCQTIINDVSYYLQRISLVTYKIYYCYLRI